MRRTLADGAWVHVPEPTAALVGSIDALTPVPAAVIDTLRAPSDRPQCIVASRWTTWRRRPVGFRVDRAVVDADHLVVAVGPGVMITAGSLPDATAQRIAETKPASRLPRCRQDPFATVVIGDLLVDVGEVVVRLDDEVEDIETAVFAPGRPSLAERIYRLVREVQAVRRWTGRCPNCSTPTRPTESTGWWWRRTVVRPWQCSCRSALAGWWSS